MRNCEAPLATFGRSLKWGHNLYQLVELAILHHQDRHHTLWLGYLKN